MSNFITHNITRLATFSGRDTRAQFWPYAGVVFAVMMVIYSVAFATRMGPLIAKTHAYTLNHPEQATVTTGPGHYSVSIEGDAPELTRAFADMAQTVLGASGVMVVVLVVLYAAAVVRRLHDRGMSGWWGIMPLPFLAFALIAMPRLFSDFAGPSTPSASTIGLFGLMFVNNMIYNVVLIILIVFLAKRSDPSINRYGPPAQT